MAPVPGGCGLVVAGALMRLVGPSTLAAYRLVPPGWQLALLTSGFCPPLFMDVLCSTWKQLGGWIDG